MGKVDATMQIAHSKKFRMHFFPSVQQEQYIKGFAVTVKYTTW